MGGVIRKGDCSGSSDKGCKIILQDTDDSDDLKEFNEFNQEEFKSSYSENIENTSKNFELSDNKNTENSEYLKSNGYESDSSKSNSSKSNSSESNSSDSSESNSSDSSESNSSDSSESNSSDSSESNSSESNSSESNSSDSDSYLSTNSENFTKSEKSISYDLRSSNCVDINMKRNNKKNDDIKCNNRPKLERKIVLESESESNSDENIINKNNNLEKLLNNINENNDTNEIMVSESIINKRINEIIKLEQTSFYNYTYFWSYFMDSKVSLYGISSLYKKLQEYHRDVGDDFIKFQIERNGNLVLNNINCPKMNLERESLGDVLESMRISLRIEKTIQEKYIELKKIGIKNYDISLINLMNIYIEGSIKILRNLTMLCSRVKRGGNGHGILLIDKELLEDK